MAVLVLAEGRPHETMEAPLHPQNAWSDLLFWVMVLLNQFFSLVLWMLTIISMLSTVSLTPPR